MRLFEGRLILKGPCASDWVAGRVVWGCYRDAGSDTGSDTAGRHLDFIETYGCGFMGKIGSSENVNKGNTLRTSAQGGLHASSHPSIVWAAQFEPFVKSVSETSAAAASGSEDYQAVSTRLQGAIYLAVAKGDLASLQQAERLIVSVQKRLVSACRDDNMARNVAAIGSPREMVRIIGQQGVVALDRLRERLHTCVIDAQRRQASTPQTAPQSTPGLSDAKLGSLQILSLQALNALGIPSSNQDAAAWGPQALSDATLHDSENAQIWQLLLRPTNDFLPPGTTPLLDNAQAVIDSTQRRQAQIVMGGAAIGLSGPLADIGKSLMAQVIASAPGRALLGAGVSAALHYYVGKRDENAQTNSIPWGEWELPLPPNIEGLSGAGIHSAMKPEEVAKLKPLLSIDETQLQFEDPFLKATQQELTTEARAIVETMSDHPSPSERKRLADFMLKTALVDILGMQKARFPSKEALEAKLAQQMAQMRRALGEILDTLFKSPAFKKARRFEDKIELLRKAMLKEPSFLNPARTSQANVALALLRQGANCDGKASLMMMAVLISDIEIPPGYTLGQEVGVIEETDPANGQSFLTPHIESALYNANAQPQPTTWRLYNGEVVRDDERHAPVFSIRLRALRYLQRSNSSSSVTQEQLLIAPPHPKAVAQNVRWKKNLPASRQDSVHIEPSWSMGEHIRRERDYNERIAAAQRDSELEREETEFKRALGQEKIRTLFDTHIKPLEADLHLDKSQYQVGIQSTVLKSPSLELLKKAQILAQEVLQTQAGQMLLTLNKEPQRRRELKVPRGMDPREAMKLKAISDVTETVGVFLSELTLKLWNALWVPDSKEWQEMQTQPEVLHGKLNLLLKQIDPNGQPLPALKYYQENFRHEKKPTSNAIQQSQAMALDFIALSVPALGVFWDSESEHSKNRSQTSRIWALLETLPDDAAKMDALQDWFNQWPDNRHLPLSTHTGLPSEIQKKQSSEATRGRMLSELLDSNRVVIRQNPQKSTQPPLAEPIFGAPQKLSQPQGTLLFSVVTPTQQKPAPARPREVSASLWFGATCFMFRSYEFADPGSLTDGKINQLMQRLNDPVMVRFFKESPRPHEEIGGIPFSKSLRILFWALDSALHFVVKEDSNPRAIQSVQWHKLEGKVPAALIGHFKSYVEKDYVAPPKRSVLDRINP